ncbi:hypothetical protein RchiOBHm_Chr4g0387101 [Rosa chinensis]|uniref:Uncharacterized protein n=1 Tax=Rosa chinensis TaxID=74649 RepID=A0A2P6QPD1_ROSCH|nr:hypothetical protein RchiOBHm_Chr4g0387101 [Rosa chinensis]
MVLLPSLATREERDKILETTKGVVLTGVAAKGQVGPIIVTEPTDLSVSTQASAGSSLPPSIEATTFVGDIPLDIPAVAVNLAGINESAHDVDPHASTGSQMVTEINVGIQISDDVLMREYVLPAEVYVNTENGHNWIEMVIDLEKLGVSDIGPPVVEALSRTKFIGLSEGFSFLNGLPHPSTFQIVNVIGTGENVMGYWTPENEFVRNLNSKTAMNSSFSTSNSSLGYIIWPGDSTSTPKGWQIPTSRTKLKILLPVQSGFKEFTNVADDSNLEQQIMMKEEFCNEQLALVYRFCRSGHFDKAKEVLVQILERWKSKVMAKIAGEENTKKPNFVLKECLKLDNKMAVCSIDTQSRSHLLSWFILFFELGNCETSKETPPYCRKASAEISLVTQSLVSQVFTAIISSPQYFRASFYGVLYDLIKLYAVIYIAFIDNAGNLLPDDSFGIMIRNGKLFYEYMNVLAKMLLRSVSKERLMSSNVSIMDTIVAALCGESITMDGVGNSFLIWLLAIHSTKFKREAASILHIWAYHINDQMVDWDVVHALMYEEGFIIEFVEKPKDRKFEALIDGATNLGIDDLNTQETPYLTTVDIYVLYRKVMSHMLQVKFSDFGTAVV